jgi:probable phosphomutase (TIGR03848 family)
VTEQSTESNQTTQTQPGDQNEQATGTEQPAEGEKQVRTEQATRILLVRHATNDWIGSGKLPGRTPGIHLNERGREEARALADRLAGMTIAAVYSSPLERARETAEIIAERLGQDVKIVDEMIEVGCGDWQGQVIEELAKTDLWRQIQLTPSTFRFPGGETMIDVQYRSASALNALHVAHPGQTIVVVSHADVIKVAAAYFMGLPLDMFQRLVVNPASITELMFTSFSPRLLRSNDSAHVPPEPPKEEADAAAEAKKEKTE